MASERQAINTQSPWWGEHTHRYKVVLKNLKGHEKMLDIACGTGFGSNLLAQNTRGAVVGGDISKEAIEDCKQQWQRKNLSFKQLDGTNLAYPDQYFDIVVSFETIEHTVQYREMLEEFARVLKPKGIAYISTPNFLINSPSGVVTNPYHTQEFVYEELKGILETAFLSVKIFGQKYSRYQQKIPRKKIGELAESLLYKRGVRKLPIGLQDFIMKGLIGKPIYPLANDYSMIDAVEGIKKCKTFFAICKK